MEQGGQVLGRQGELTLESAIGVRRGKHRLFTAHANCGQNFWVPRPGSEPASRDVSAHMVPVSSRTAAGAAGCRRTHLPACRKHFLHGSIRQA